MAKSQNGWSAGTPAQIGGLDNSYVPGTKVKVVPGVRKGDVATVLFYVAEQYNLHVEKLHAGWCWGYAYRPIRGKTTGLSNHAAGCAIDLNAPEHPLGKAGTYSSKQIAAIKKILDFCGGVVRCGAFYTGRKDDMHFEINASSAKVAALAKKIRASRAPKPSTPVKPTTPAKPPVKPAPWKPGLKVDGDLGPSTIRAWQRIMGTPQDGKIGHPSDLVKAVQRHLNAKAGAKLRVDGVGIAQDGRATSTIKALQKYLGTFADGKLSKGSSDAIKALQRRLNTGKF